MTRLVAEGLIKQTALKHYSVGLTEIDLGVSTALHLPAYLWMQFGKGKLIQMKLQ